MVTNFASLSPSDPLERAVELTLAGSQRHYPVMDGDRLVGILTQAGLLAGLTVRGGHSPVADSMAETPPLISPHAPLASVFQRLQELPEGVAPVGTGTGISGLIDRDNLIDLLRIRGAVAQRASGATAGPSRRP